MMNRKLFIVWRSQHSVGPVARRDGRVARAIQASAARMLEYNPDLMNLRLLQDIASATENGPGNTLVMGISAEFVPVGMGRRSPHPRSQGRQSTKRTGEHGRVSHCRLSRIGTDFAFLNCVAPA
jgi:hypothetical protein